MNYKITRTFLALVLVAAFATVLRAPQAATTTQPSSEDRVALYQALLDLQNPWTVMCVAAHPDDEDGTSLIVMRHKYGAHTVSLFSTFGEGGQNAIGPELYEEMGAIRARETMAAAEIQGSEPHFLGLKDFGFSKTRDEAFKFWGHEEALRRMVLEIRKLRPDVIITNHSTTSNDHGQHQATALMVVEAFDAAADPTKFPEQLKDGLSTWQVQRLFVRARGNQQPAANTQIVTIDPNEKDPVRGVVYGEEALRALQKHATQGPWPKTFAEYANRFRAFSGQTSAPTGQLPLIRYALVKSANGATGLPAQESHNFLDGLRLSREVADEIEVPTITPSGLMQSIETRELTRDVLLQGYRGGLYGLSSVNEKDRQRLALMRGRLERAIQLFAGLSTTVDLPSPTLVPGSSVPVTIKVNNAGGDAVEISNCRSFLASGSDPTSPGREAKGEKIGAGATGGETVNVTIPPGTPINVPVATHLYEPSALGISLDTRCSVLIANTKVDLEALTYANVAPPVDIASISPSPLVIRPDEVGASSAGADTLPAKLPDLKIELINYRDQRFNGEVLFGLKNQEPQTSRKIELLPHQIATLELPMPKPEKIAAAHTRSSAAPELVSVTVRATNSRENITSREIPIVRANARVARNLRIGYVRGFDFSLPNALNALGVESKELSVDDVRTTDLSKFTSVIVDNRVYESQPELIAVNQKLLDYANAGGTLIVFYHKSDEWNPDERRNRPQLAPYKLILGGERVTDENAPITFIEPDHPLLNTPNRMGQDDFKDWIQERGLYYPREWDPQFHALLQSNDPGEQPLKGGLLVADYGKGHYIYTSMVWYRELRGGIPGAYRMLANMISYGQK
jgi:LmbE family N-acetylglucosaminyl deacetylase